MVLLLVIVFGFRMTESVCTLCYGSSSGCPNTDIDHCPITVGTAANAKALAGSVVGTLVVANLLPIKIVRSFPRRVLDSLSAMAAAPISNVFDCSGKTVKEIFNAVVNGYATPEDAVIELQKNLLAAADEDVTKISKTMDTITGLKRNGARRTNGTREGALLYLWAMTAKCIGEADVVLIFGESEEDEKDEKSRYTAKLIRPTSAMDFVSRINIWVMTCQATGVGHALVTTPFLEDVVFGNLRLGKDWKVVHELLLLYLLQVDTTESMNLSNVYASGGQDTKMKEAEANAGKYFRFPRGEPATTGGSGTP